jgi:hypothetical protein
MLDNILSSELREQAGANSYNRFDYQVHWIVYHMIKEFKKGNEFLIFCEFHDDMAKSSCIKNPDCLEFFQIKTTETKKEWKLKDLFKVDNKSHSFLGFIFYNFIKFNSECEKCHFVSNIEPDKELLEWQSFIEDEKVLQKENYELYEKIRKLIRKEFNEEKEEIFNTIYDKFIQNTFIYYGDLPLQQYEKIVLGEFCELLSDTNIYVSNSNKIFKDIIESVRKKSKTKIKIPISLTALKDKKAISSEVFKLVQEKIVEFPKKEELYNEIEEVLLQEGYSKLYCRKISRKLRKHHSKMLDISNSLYIDNCEKVYLNIDFIIEDNAVMIEKLNLLKDKALIECKDILNDIEDIDEILVEAMLYEKLLSR